MAHLRFPFLLLAAVLALGPMTAAAQSGPAPEQGSALTAELMYRLLVGDVALQRGDVALAARAYLEAARDAKDARIARRATEIALAARQRALAVEAARLWSELEPTAERPKQVIAGLSGGAGAGGAELKGFGSDLQTELERALAEAAAGSNIGEAFMQLNRALAGEPDKAAVFRLVRSLAEPYPKVPEARFAVALAAYSTGLGDSATTAAALEAVHSALALKPGWEPAVLLEAEILARQSPERAADYLVEFLKAEPESKAALTSLAQVRVRQKRFADAIAILKGLADRDPGNQEYTLGMAMLAIQMKDWTTAEALFEALRRAGYGDEGQVEFYLAQIAEETGRYELAIERFRAVPDGERGWIAKLRVATIMGKLKRVDEARRYLADLPAVTVEQRVQVRQAEAQVLRDAGENTQAFAVLTAALDAQPDEPDLLYDLAMVAEKVGRLDVAEAKLARLIELKPDNAQALNALGYTLVDRTPRLQEGLALIERALALAPDDPFILDSMGWAQFRLGKLDEAEKSLRRAMEERPDPEIAAHLGEVLWAKGERARAQEVWQSQLKSVPDNPVLLETVQRLTR